MFILELSFSNSVLCVAHGSSVVECRTRNRESAGSNHPFVVSGPTPNKALFKELVAPPGDFRLIVPVFSLII